MLYADVVGYSRLVGLDDTGTLHRLREMRRLLIDPAIEEHGGRLVNTGGDSLLVVFDSVDGAVRCAVKVQQHLPILDGDRAPDEAIRFRMGINIGDAIPDGNDLHGDAINVAARLQTECPPEGICVSRSVRDHVHHRLGLEFDELGPLNLKNIARPVEAFVLRRDLSRKPQRRSAAVQARSTRRLSIVVLLFANLSHDPDQDYFADGITEDVTTDLSRISHMTVISRNTAFTYKNKAITTRQIGQKLAVSYVLEGSIQRWANHLRVNAQLIDAETEAHIWAERFDVGTDNLSAIQNEITSRITIALNLELLNAEAIKPTDNPDALDYLLRGRAAYSKPPSLEKYAEAISWFERALILDPGSVMAQGWLAITLTARCLDSMAEARSVDIERAEVLSVQAAAMFPRSALPHFARGQVLRAQDRFQDAIPEYEMVLDLDRNWVNAYNALGQCKLFAGSLEETIPLEEQAIRLSPRDPMLGNWYWSIGRVHLLQSRVDEAISWLERARAVNPGLPVTHAYLASAYALTNRMEQSTNELLEARRLSSLDRYTTITRLRAAQSWGVPQVRALFEVSYFAGLRKAGVQDE